MTSIGKYIPAVITGLSLLTVALTGVFKGYNSTSSTEVGVKTRTLGKPGIEEKVYPPGSTYVINPFTSLFNKFDTKLNVDEMNLKFKTREGNDIGVDVRYTWRVIPEKAPYVLENVAGSIDELREKVFVTIARSETRDYYGELTTQSFYQATNRNVITEKATKGLANDLKKFGVELIEIGLMDYKFMTNYQSIIEKRKLSEQNRLSINQQKNAQHEANAKMTNEIQSVINVMINDINTQYSNTVSTADAYFDQQKSLVNAILREGQNTAETITKEREALASQGGETKVKMSLLEAIKGKKIIMYPSYEQGALNVQTFNINDFLKTHGIKNSDQ